LRDRRRPRRRSVRFFNRPERQWHTLYPAHPRWAVGKLDFRISFRYVAHSRVRELRTVELCGTRVLMYDPWSRCRAACLAVRVPRRLARQPCLPENPLRTAALPTAWPAPRYSDPILYDTNSRNPILLLLPFRRVAHHSWWDSNPGHLQHPPHHKWRGHRHTAAGHSLVTSQNAQMQSTPAPTSPPQESQNGTVQVPA